MLYYACYTSVFAVQLFLLYCEYKDDRDTGCSLLLTPLPKVGGHLHSESFGRGSWFNLQNIVSGIRDQKVLVSDMRNLTLNGFIEEIIDLNVPCFQGTNFI